jgi:hypothetical protein
MEDKYSWECIRLGGSVTEDKLYHIVTSLQRDQNTKRSNKTTIARHNIKRASLVGLLTKPKRMQ